MQRRRADILAAAPCCRWDPAAPSRPGPPRRSAALSVGLRALPVLVVLGVAPSSVEADVIYELEWGQIVERTGERPRVQVLTCDTRLGPADCAMLATFFNVLTSQADLDIEIGTTIGHIGIKVAPREGRVTDVLSVDPPPGYIAEPPRLDVAEGETGIIVVRPMLLGSR